MKYCTLRIVLGTLATVCALRSALGAAAEEKLNPPSLPQGGIGLALRIENGKVLVEKVLPDTPAAKGNTVKRGDQVAAISEGADKPTDLTSVKELAKVIGRIR